MKRQFIPCLVLFLLCAFIACSCSTSTQSPTINSTSPSTTQVKTATSSAVKPIQAPQTGGVFKIITSITPLNLGDPAQTSRPADNIWSLAAMESLLTFDDNGQPAPCLATSWQLAPGNTFLTLNLRKGVKFVDGADFNSQAVKINLERYKQMHIGTAFDSVSSIDVVDDYTVRLNLSSIDVSLFSSLAGRPAGMESPAALKAHDKDWFLTNIVGTGPFKLASYKRDTVIKYERNPDYWNKPKPYLDGIEIDYITDKTTASMSYQAGESNALRTSGNEAATLTAKGYKYTKTSGGFFSLTMDGSNASSPFGSVLVRQAAGYAIDNKAIAQAVGFGTYDPVNQLAPSSSWAYNPTVKGYPYDPNKAKQLLKEAGFPNGFQTTLYGTSAVDQSYFQSIQGYLKEVGVDVKIEMVTTAKASDLELKGWQNGMMTVTQGAASGTADPSQNLKAVYASNSNRFVSMFHSKDVDDKINQAMFEFDFNKRKALIWDLEQLIVDKYCMVVPIYLTGDYLIQNPGIHDLKLFEQPYVQWTPADAWMEKK